MLSRTILFSGAGVTAALVLSGCGSAGSATAGAKEQVVAAFYPLAFAAQEIGQEAVEVRNLTPAGAEPHDLELTPGDVRAVAAADLVLYVGGGFMPGLETALRERSGPSLDVLAATRRPAGEPVGDPHVWLDPIRFAAMVHAVGEALGREEAAARVAERVARLDADYRRGLAHCKRHAIVTSHAAFGHLAARYGLKQIPLEGLAPEAEPSARGIAKLVDLVRRSGATTVFAETLVSPKLAQTVAREAGVRTALLDPLEGLGEDALAAGADYFSVMRTNLATLETALGCTA